MSFPPPIRRSTAAPMSHGYHTFAPLDLLDEIAGIEAVTSHFSSLPQVACFDSPLDAGSGATLRVAARPLGQRYRRDAHELICP
jgi:hypothetical protein